MSMLLDIPATLTICKPELSQLVEIAQYNKSIGSDEVLLGTQIDKDGKWMSVHVKTSDILGNA